MMFSYPSFWLRLLAHLIDFIFLNAIEYGLEEGVSKVFGMTSFQEQVVGVILSLALCYAYYVELPIRKETTLGKRVFRIYVVDAKTAQPFTRKQAIIRACGYLASYAIIGCGFLMALFQPDGKALHDLIAGTVCVRRPKETTSASDPKAL